MNIIRVYPCLSMVQKLKQLWVSVVTEFRLPLVDATKEPDPETDKQ